ncbi:hypothetical protein FHX42_004944 [Saccharopolyspora lacisalsi]|uniref:Uncharacterized protein n=1 Tax=Halosaccharopolyspora lacisalsi TaxID=1000566 RepID=A0A839E9M8_9PSEU|nr:hypothetical protein [Halosaccharopolyspora lacisalsi]MBA8827548.1 hypothetical protein [Halosaccharopolyspora lacisalsi]
MTFPGTVTGGSAPPVVDEGLPVVAEVRHPGGFEKAQKAAVGVSSCHGTRSGPRATSGASTPTSWST